MTYNEVKKYLKSYQEHKYNIEFYRNKMGGLKAISYSQEEKGTTQDNMMSVYMEKIEEEEKKMLEIERFIESNLKGFERNVIWKRYVDCLRIKEICSLTKKSQSYINEIIKNSILKCSKKD